jgi:hypothetical protein
MDRSCAVEAPRPEGNELHIIVDFRHDHRSDELTSFPVGQPVEVEFHRGAPVSRTMK